MRPSVPDVHITDARDLELAAYHPLAGQAVVGLIFGLLSPLALIDPGLWIFPALGVVFGVWALRRIEKNAPELTGRGMAVVGLTLSLLLASAAPADWLVYRKKLREEAREFSAEWFRCLAHDAPHRAYQFTLPPSARRLGESNLWSVYRDSPRLRQHLESYVTTPLVRTLLALGPRAQVRFYDTVSQNTFNGNDQVEQLYAVTFEEAGEKKSFFVDVHTERIRLDTGVSGWRIVQARTGMTPAL